MNDIYHNAIWMKKEQDGEEKDELVWVKYPKEAVMVATGGDNGWMGWLDPDRQFQYGLGISDRYRTTLLFEFDVLDCVLFYSNYGNTGYYYVTQDGITWKKVNGNPVGTGGTTVNYFGNDGFCTVPAYMSNLSYSIPYTRLIHDEENDEWSFENKTLTIRNAFGGRLIYLCGTNEGAMFAEWTSYEPSGGANYVTDMQYVRVDRDGNRHEGMHEFYQWNEAFPTTESNGKTSCRNKNMCAFAEFERVGRDRYSGYHYYRLVVGCTSDYGENWTFKILKTYGDNDSNIGKYELFARGDAIYLIFGCLSDQNGKIYYWKTTDGENWEEIPLPSWVDLPVQKNGGYGVNQNPTSKDVIRIAIAPNETSGADLSLYMNFLNQRTSGIYNTDFRDRNSYYIRFKDGELEKENEDFYLCIGSPSGWMAFFDNEYFASSSRAFAWRGNYAVKNVPDTLQENDYCVRALTPIESEVEK